jgi:hypothetical protein
MNNMDKSRQLVDIEKETDSKGSLWCCGAAKSNAKNYLV